MEEAVIKRILPHSIEAEQAVLGAMLINPDVVTEADERLTGEDFYQRSYGVLFDAMLELYHKGRPIDLITLQEQLKAKNIPPELGSMELVRELAANVQTSANADAYIKIIREKSILRKMIKINEEISGYCYQEKPVDEVLEQAEKSVFDLVERGTSGEFVPIDQVVRNALDVIDRAAKAKGAITGIATGFLDLDDMLSGLQRADLILLAARPSMGKTAFALNIAQHAAFHDNLSVVIFSLEMSKEQLVNRLFSLQSFIDARKLRTGRLEDQEWPVLAESAGIISHSKLIIDDTADISVAELRSKCRKYKLEHDLDLIIIDYIQLMRGSSNRRNIESRNLEIAEISRALKVVARELNVPIIVLSQLSREVEKRGDKRPMLSDLRDSGAIEQDADVCLFIYRDEYYHEDTDYPGEAEIIIAKQRNGPTGTVTLRWIPELTRFHNLDRTMKE